MEDDDVDFAVAAWREDGRWQVASLQARVLESVERLAEALRHLPGEAGTLALISVAEEFFVLARVQGDAVRLFMSDVAAALDWPFAEGVLDRLGVEMPHDDDELDDIEPVGDLGIVADLGMDAAELEMLCRDPELYPEEQVSSIAARLGFGDQLDAELDG